MTERFCGGYFPDGFHTLRPAGSKIKVIFHSDAHTSGAGFFFKMGLFKADKPDYM